MVVQGAAVDMVLLIRAKTKKTSVVARDCGLKVNVLFLNVVSGASADCRIPFMLSRFSMSYMQNKSSINASLKSYAMCLSRFS